MNQNIKLDVAAANVYEKLVKAQKTLNKLSEMGYIFDDGEPHSLNDLLNIVDLIDTELELMEVSHDAKTK